MRGRLAPSICAGLDDAVVNAAQPRQKQGHGKTGRLPDTGDHHAVNAVSDCTSQSKLKLAQPMSCMSFSSPRLGFRIHFQAVPVTMNDKAMGYK